MICGGLCAPTVVISGFFLAKTGQNSRTSIPAYLLRTLEEGNRSLTPPPQNNHKHVRVFFVTLSAILGVHVLDLWDDEPGSDWTTSYALGNGYLGAMLGMGTFKVR